MLIVPPQKLIKKQPTIRPPKVVAIAPLVLLAASYDPNLLLILLTFNQPVNTAAAVVTAITVTDPVTHQLTYIGNGPVVAYGANGVQIHLLAQEGSLGSQVTLTVGSSNGIVAASGGAALAAINMLVLPYT